MSDRTRRQEAILELLRTSRIRNQKELITALRQAGHAVTQSTLSRELKALGVAKTPDGRGGYRYAASESTGSGPLTPVISFVRGVERARNLVVVKTPPGNAQGVAHALDEIAWSEVMGTIAGDDTILLICRGDDSGERVLARLRSLARLAPASPAAGR